MLVASEPGLAQGPAWGARLPLGRYACMYGMYVLCPAGSACSRRRRPRRSRSPPPLGGRHRTGTGQVALHPHPHPSLPSRCGRAAFCLVLAALLHTCQPTCCYREPPSTSQPTTALGSTSHPGPTSYRGRAGLYSELPPAFSTWPGAAPTRRQPIVPWCPTGSVQHVVASATSAPTRNLLPPGTSRWPSTSRYQHASLPSW